MICDSKICQRCNRVRHFAQACPANLTPPRAPTLYQNYRHSYISSATSQHPGPSYTPSQHSQCPFYRPNANRLDTMGYRYPQDTAYTNPSQRPPFPSTDRTDNKYQTRRSNVPGQQNNYSNVIQNHALQDWQCLVSANLDNKHITVLIDTGFSISLLDEQLYYLLSLVPPLQPILFSISIVVTDLLLCWVKHSYPLLSTTTHFESNLLLREISLSLWYWESVFYRHMVELSVFQLTNYTSVTPLLNLPPHLSMPITCAIIHINHAHTQPIPPTFTHHISYMPTLSYN